MKTLILTIALASSFAFAQGGPAAGPSEEAKKECAKEVKNKHDKKAMDACLAKHATK